MENFYRSLVELYEMLNIGSNVNETFDFISRSFKDYVPFDRISVALLDSNANIYLHSSFEDYTPVLKPGYNKKVLETSLDDIISTKKPRVINDYNKYIKSNPNSESAKLMLKEGIKSSIAYPLVASDICLGVMFFSSKTSGVYNEQHVNLARMIANNMAIIVELNLFVDDMILTSITGFARIIEAKDLDTGHHIERMQNYSRIIATSLAASEKYSGIINEKFINDLYKFSPLHDLGKVGIADGILLKPAKLTTEEFEVMKMHTIIGADILKKASNNLLRKGRHFFDTAIDIALCHHERYDGSGYPHGLSRNQIPLSARIVLVADVLDALTSKRVYKTPLDFSSSLIAIQEESGKSFDPDIVDAMFRCKDELLDTFEKYEERPFEKHDRVMRVLL